MLIRTFQQQDEGRVIELWNDCGLIRPWNNPSLDIARKLTEQPELFLVAEESSAASWPDSMGTGAGCITSP